MSANAGLQWERVVNEKRGYNGRGDSLSPKRAERRALERIHGRLSGRQWRKLRAAAKRERRELAAQIHEGAQ